MSNGTGQRIIVVGAGVSGIAAAYRLKQKGFDVTILERKDYIGGKARTVRRNGYLMEEGASVLPSKYRNVLAIAHELGMADELIPGGSIVGFARDGKIHNMDSAHLIRDALGTKLISLRSKLRMLGLALDNLRIRSKINYEDITTCADWDIETAQQYCRRRANDEIFEYIVDSTLRGLLGTSGEKQSVVDFFFSFNNVIGSKLLSFKQGMGFFPNAVVERAGLDVRLNATVEEVRETPNGAVVSWSDAQGARTDNVSGVIVAVPAYMASGLVPGLPQAAHEILRSIKYTTSVNISLGLAKPPPNNPAFVVQVPRSVHPDLFGIVLEHNKAPGRVPPGKGMASLYTMSDWAEKLMEMDNATVIDQITAAGESVIPGLTSGVEFAHVSRWYPVIVYSEPGTYRRLVDLNAMLAKVRRVRFAGDYFSCSNLNTAVAGGERAARELGESCGETLRQSGAAGQQAGRAFSPS
ncbi:MAG: protoporphyrinogen/coproporphyrinogen oxidase [Panacagrimonas sp.]